MPQLHLYVTDDLAEHIRRAADEANMSVSRYIAELVRRTVNGHWPDGFFEEVIGGWQGEPLVRPGQGEYEAREPLTTG